MRHLLQRHGRLLARLEERPWNALYRIMLGFALLPIYFHLLGGEAALVPLLLFFLGVLVLLRFVPAVVRHVFRFSDDVRSFWKERRQMAKRCDSYQWQKLFWIGLGLAAYIAYSGNPSKPQVTLAASCLLSGALGLALWKRKGLTLKTLNEQT